MAVTMKKGNKTAITTSVAEMNKVAAKTTTTVKHGKTSAVVKEQVQELVAVPAVYANVGVTASRTIPLEEYANVKLGVSIYRPCENTDEAIQECYEKCVAWVDEKMTGLCEEHDKAKEE